MQKGRWNSCYVTANAFLTFVIFSEKKTFSTLFKIFGSKVQTTLVAGQRKGRKHTPQTDGRRNATTVKRRAVKLEFHGTSFPRSILVTSSRGCPQ